MNKRIIVLVLLLLSVFFYSCSSQKNSTVINSKKIVIPEHSKFAHEDYNQKKKKNEKELDPKQQHYDRQSKSVQKTMKKNEKASMKNTPVKKRKKSCRPFSKRRGSCVGGIDNFMLDEGIRDVR